MVGASSVKSITLGMEVSQHGIRAVASCHCGRRRWRLAFQSWRHVVQARATENARYDDLGLEAAGRTAQFLAWLAANFSRETANGDREFNEGVTSQRVVQAIQTFGVAPRRRGGASAPYIQENARKRSAHATSCRSTPNSTGSLRDAWKRRIPRGAGQEAFLSPAITRHLLPNPDCFDC
jgi:hypothetical protein